MFEVGTDAETECETPGGRCRAAVERAADVAAMSDRDCMERVLEIEREIRVLHAEELHLLRAIDRRGSVRHRGWRTVAGWLKKCAGMSGAAAQARVRTARALEDLPRTKEALDTGTLSFEHAAAVARQHRPETAALLARHEAVIVPQAEKLTVDQFRVVMGRWNELATQELATEPVTARRDRYFHLNETMGAWFGECKLDAEGGAYVSSTLDRIGNELAAEAKRAREADGSLDHFTFASEVRGAALVEMARRADAWDAKKQKFREPAFTVVITLADLAAGLGAETEAGNWIPGETVKRLGCNGAVTPVIVESLEHPKPLDVGRTLRLPSYEQRRAIVARDRHCRFPGCDLPPDRCEVHHLVPWEEGGPTDLWNQALYCSSHHHLGHEGGWKYAGHANDPEGIDHRRPDGTLHPLDAARNRERDEDLEPERREHSPPLIA